MQAVQCNKLYTVVCIVHCIAHFTLQRRQRGLPILLGTVPSLPHLQFSANCTDIFFVYTGMQTVIYIRLCNVMYTIL